MSLDQKLFAVSATVAVVLAGAYGSGLGFEMPWSATTPLDLPVTENGYVRADAIEAYEEFMMSGGPPPDGIPSIDDPQFVSADEVDLDPGDMIIGYEHEGDARAYPHAILVQHEIVNDEVGGLNVAITYCPLTATAQGFERGSSTLGTSGQLLNSNLVMYDRETESYFAQINPVGLTGPHRGKSLVEVDLIWTTWERWRSVHPDTRVLSRDTGYMRNYDNDPYGTYNPLGGYYQQDRTVFPLMHRNDRHHAKEMVVGARTEDRSAYFVLEELESDRVQTTDSFVAVYDPDLHTAHIYRDEDARVTARDDGGYEFEGEAYAAAELPLEKLISLEAFFFAWNAFFPASESV